MPGEHRFGAHSYGCVNGASKAMICNCGIRAVLRKGTKCYGSSRTWDTFSVSLTKKTKLAVLH